MTRASVKSFLRRWLMVIAAGSTTAPAMAQTIIYYPPAGGVNGTVVNSFTADQYFARVCFGATTPDVSLERAAAGLVKVTDCGGGPTLKNLQANLLFSGDAIDALTGDTIPSSASIAAFGVPIFTLGGAVKRTTTAVVNRQAGHISHIIVNPASPTNRIQRSYYGAVELGADNTGARSRGVTSDVYNVGASHATSITGFWADVFNGVYVPIFTGGGLLDEAIGISATVHQQTANTGSAITSAQAAHFVVDSNSPNSPVTNATAVTGWVFADAPDPSGLKSVSTGAGGDFETVAFAGTCTTCYAVFQYVQQSGGAVTTGYGNYIFGVEAATKWAYYNNDATAPSLSKSNWRAPFFAGEASTTLVVGSNIIAPVNVISHVGAGLVKTITVPAMCSPTCTVFLIPDSAFTYDATGNIVVPAGSGTAVVSRVMSMTWDGTKWYPSY